MLVKIRTKLVVTTIPILFLVLLIGYMGSMKIAKDLLNREIDERTSTQVEIQKESLEKSLGAAQQMSRDLSAVVENTYHTEGLSEYIRILKSFIQSNPFVLGSGIWFEPYQYDRTKKFVGPYVYKTGSEITTTYEYSNEKYNYFQQDYYLLTKQKMQMLITDMYYDQTSGLYMMTCSQPIKDTNGKFLGCISVDIEMSSMQKFVSDFNATHHAYVSIINQLGKYIASEDSELVKKGTAIIDSSNKSFQGIASQILENHEGILQYDNHGQKMNVYFATLNDWGWKMLIEIPESEILKPLIELSKFFLFIFAMSLLFLTVFIYVINDRSINKPVQSVLLQLERIGSNTHKQGEENLLKIRKDEFGKIGNALQQMEERLKRYQNEIKDSLEKNIAANEELQQQNEELIESEIRINHSLKYSSSLMEAIPDTVFVISKDGEFLDCTGDMKHLFFEKNIFIGKKIDEVMPGEIADRGLQLLQEASMTGDIQKMQYEWQNENVTEYHELRIVKWFDDKVLAIARNVTDTHNYISQIEYACYHDQLTGIYNRRYFDKYVNQLCEGKHYPIAFVISDLNGLKMINDSFGYEQGNEMLKHFTEILLNAGTKDAIVCRIDGDEFISILCCTNEENANNYIKEVMEQCSNTSVNGIVISVSCGYSLILDNLLTVQAAIKKAEDQMYQNKIYESSSRRSRTIDLILSTLHEKNSREEMHSRRVAELCELMAGKMGMNKEEIKKIKTAAILHDIGKIGVQEDLLNKPGALSKEEYGEICKHAEIGYRILSTAPNMSEIAEIVLSHHERWDGKGYPRGIGGDSIPLCARMISIADTYDAITSDRSYRKALSPEFAIAELKKNAEKQFDPELVDVFVNYVVNLDCGMHVNK